MRGPWRQRLCLQRPSTVSPTAKGSLKYLVWACVNVHAHLCMHVCVSVLVCTSCCVLSSSRQISESFKSFGMSDESRNVLVVPFEDSAEPVKVCVCARVLFVVCVCFHLCLCVCVCVCVLCTPAPFPSPAVLPTVPASFSTNVRISPPTPLLPSPKCSITRYQS